VLGILEFVERNDCLKGQASADGDMSSSKSMSFADAPSLALSQEDMELPSSMFFLDMKTVVMR